MENKFTKGQWVIEAGLQLNITAGKNGFVIANVTKDGIFKMIGNEAEGYANAKLIAAAPELYRENKELKEMVKQLCGIITSNCDWTKFNKQEFEIMESANAILTAIKSATE